MFLVRPSQSRLIQEQWKHQPFFLLLLRFGSGEQLGEIKFALREGTRSPSNLRYGSLSPVQEKALWFFSVGHPVDPLLLLPDTTGAGEEEPFYLGPTKESSVQEVKGMVIVTISNCMNGYNVRTKSKSRVS